MGLNAPDPNEAAAFEGMYVCEMYVCVYVRRKCFCSPDPNEATAFEGMYVLCM